MKKRKQSLGAKIKTILLDPHHPEHAGAMAAFLELGKSLRPYLQEMKVAVAQYEAAEQDAIKLVDLLDRGASPADFAKLRLNGIGALYFRSKMQSKAARRERTDALQKLILRFVKENPSITKAQLLNALEREKGQGIIVDIVDEEISFQINENEPLDKAPIAGLKDRLYRAKKHLSSR